jgi:hypothetical protein
VLRLAVVGTSEWSGSGQGLDGKRQASTHTRAFSVADDIKRAPQQPCAGIHPFQSEAFGLEPQRGIKPAAIIVDFYEEAAALLLETDRGFGATAVFPAVRQGFLADAEDCRPDRVWHVVIIAVMTAVDGDIESNG